MKKQLRLRLLALLLILVPVLFTGGCIIVDDDDSNSWEADMDLRFSPSEVVPVYDSASHEWRWYFDIILEERGGLGVRLDTMRVRFYTLGGTFEYEIDYSGSLYSWFGSTWLPADGTLRHLDTFWYNSDGSAAGWRAVMTISGIDEAGNRVSTDSELTCLSGEESAALGCAFYPSVVSPVYDYTYHEWRWYFDWSVFETEGTAVSLNGLVIDFYDTAGNFMESVDYTDSIINWFGTTWLPAYGELNCTDRFWINTDGSGLGWQMRYNYYGRDVHGTDVGCSGWVSLLNASYYRSNESSDDIVTPESKIHHNHEGDTVKTILPAASSHFLMQSE